jgi:hypothetical protein
MAIFSGKVIFELWGKSGGLISRTEEIGNAMIPLGDVLHKAKNGVLDQKLALRNADGKTVAELHVKLAYTAYAGAAILSLGSLDAGISVAEG